MKIQPEREGATPRESLLRRRIRKLLVLMIGGLVLSGLTAFPIESELNLLADILKVGSGESGIAGPLRGIPLYWRVIDCSFGIVGAIPLWLCRRYITELEKLQHVRSRRDRIPQQKGPE